MSPALVVLAAGMGSRFGGLKQLETVGPAGWTLLDYSVHDARRAGFGTVVFIIRRVFAEEFRARVGARHARDGEVRYAFQEIGDLPAGFFPSPGREKPWGTGHAVWCARGAIDRPFAVINADDFYGADAYRQLAQFLAGTDARAAQFALAGYRLGATLSEHGAVSRGVCRVDETGRLLGIEEQTALAPDGVGGGARNARGDSFPADTIVSMNSWAFTPALLPLLEARLVDFLRARGGDAKAEFYLPAAIGAMVTAGQARVRVLPTSARWHGLTYREDRAAVDAALRALHDAGEYPHAP